MSFLNGHRPQKVPHLNILFFFLFHSPEFWNTQVNAPQPESCAVVAACSQTAEEKSSVSEYFSCVTSAGKLFPADKDGKE